MFQELRFYNILDPIADSLVLQSHVYEYQLEEYQQADDIQKIILGMPTPTIGYRYDSSTGLGQIFASTAIDATNWYESTGYDRTDKEDLEKFWNDLQDNGYNIDMIGRVLAYKKSIILQ